MFCQGLENALADPPHRIGNEFETTGFIELFRRFDEAQVAFVDEVRQAEALILVLLGYGNHKAEIRAGEFFQGFLVPFANALGQFHFFVRGDEFFTTNLLQVLVQRRALAVGDGLGNFKLSHLYTKKFRSTHVRS